MFRKLLDWILTPAPGTSKPGKFVSYPKGHPAHIATVD